MIDEKFERLGKELKMQLGNALLEESIWTPKKEKCEHKIDIKARVISANVTGRDAYQREKTLRWLLKRNTHIEEISEKFSKGNHWCIIIFDCRKGYREAKIELENKKEDHEWLQFLVKKLLEIN